ncbi:hypothetical protein CDAR_209781 [Caerostris darwini]|uniref:Uncharacterized protein n=1 Tax=Caerostris darwini TaxID=1538125 RepID=A0AAV4SZI2_9ARAC|nr:hypothetical protein CDAR_209781 [Caerostris darwini]
MKAITPSWQAKVSNSSGHFASFFLDTSTRYHVMIHLRVKDFNIEQEVKVDEEDKEVGEQDEEGRKLTVFILTDHVNELWDLSPSARLEYSVP